MTWENDKNETATQIYSFIADFDEKIYANEERREDSLIQQAAHMPSFLPLRALYQCYTLKKQLI